MLIPLDEVQKGSIWGAPESGLGLIDHAQCRQITPEHGADGPEGNGQRPFPVAAFFINRERNGGKWKLKGGVRNGYEPSVVNPGSALARGHDEQFRPD